MTTLRLALAVGVVTTMIIAVSESAVLDPAKHPGDLVDSSQSQVSPAQDQSRDDLTLALAELNDSNEDLSDEPLPQVSTDAHIREKSKISKNVMVNQLSSKVLI